MKARSNICIWTAKFQQRTAGTVKAINYHRSEKTSWWNTMDTSSWLIVTALEIGEILPTATYCPETCVFWDDGRIRS